MVSRSQEDKNMALWRELTRNFFEIVEDVSEMIPTSKGLKHFRRGLRLSKQDRSENDLSYLNIEYSHFYNQENRLSPYIHGFINPFPLSEW